MSEGRQPYARGVLAAFSFELLILLPVRDVERACLAGDTWITEKE